MYRGLEQLVCDADLIADVDYWRYLVPIVGGVDVVVEQAMRRSFDQRFQRHPLDLPS